MSVLLVAQTEPTPLTPAGWVFMLASIAFVIGLIFYCFRRVVTTPDNSERHMHAPLDIDTQDRET